MAYGDFKDLFRRTASDKVLCGIAFNIAKNPKHDGCKRGLTLMVYIFFGRRTSNEHLRTRANSENKHSSNLAEKLHKPITRKFEKLKVPSSFIDNICGAELVDMQLISKFNKGFRFLLSVIDIIYIIIYRI